MKHTVVGILVMVSAAAVAQPKLPISESIEHAQTEPAFSSQAGRPQDATTHEASLSTAARVAESPDEDEVAVDQDLLVVEVSEQSAVLLPEDEHSKVSTEASPQPTTATDCVCMEVESSPSDDSRTMTARWDNGLRFTTSDGAFKFLVGGRLHLDMLWWNAPQDVQFGPGGVGELADGTAFRRARIRLAGRMWDAVEWNAEFGFERGTPAFFDVYGAIPDLPYVGDLYIGHFREPFSLDALTSGNNLTFMERSLIQEALVPFRNVGVMFRNTAFEQSATWALGGFYPDSNSYGYQAEDGTYALTGRGTMNPWYEDDGLRAFHFGLAGSWRAMPATVLEGEVDAPSVRGFRLATRPEIRVSAPLFADTGFVPGNNGGGLVGVEAGLGLGPVLLQAEYAGAFADDVQLPGNASQSASVYFHGYYLQASYFLTGEGRPYDREAAVFGGVTPKRDFSPATLSGTGAWEVGLRYSYLDLNQATITGGELKDVTFGLNWYLNPNTRVMWNYLLIWRDTVAGTSDGLTQAFATRFQFDY